MLGTLIGTNYLTSRVIISQEARYVKVDDQGRAARQRERALTLPAHGPGTGNQRDRAIGGDG